MNSASKMKAKILELDSCPNHVVASDSVVIATDFEPSQVVRLAVQNEALHVVQKKSRCFQQELQIAETMLYKPQEFISDPLSFILGKSEGNTFRFDCKAHENKKDPLEKLEKYIQSLPGSKSILSEVVSSTEEIFTNASKNTGNFYKRLENVNPTGSVKSGSISLVAGASGDILVVGCIDSFGLLDVKALMGRILACYDRGVAESINMGSGGAGIGTFLVYSFAMNLYIAVEKNKRTAIFCSYPLGVRARELELLPKNLHLLSY